MIYPGQILKIKNVSNEHLIKYVIKNGDTLFNIASKYNTTVNELVRINKIKNKNIINGGEIIYIPQSSLY